MDDLVVKQEKKGLVEVFQDVPHDLQRHALKHALPHSLRGDHFRALWQQFPGLGFFASLNCYWMKKPVVLTSTATGPVLELRIALKNMIGGTWDKISMSALLARFFQMTFVPHVATRAKFDVPGEYITFDIHFELWWLEKCGFDFKSLERFITRVSNGRIAAELSERPHHITMKMLDNIHDILDMRYADFGVERTLEDLVKEILFEALEVVLVAERRMPELSAEEEDKLDEVKLIIEKDCPRYQGNEKLKQAAGLNEFSFYTGFKQKFRLTPHDHHLGVKMMMAKQLLREGKLINDVAHLLEYGSSSPFIERFGKTFGCTPKEFQMGRISKEFRQMDIVK